ncbi:hypothetical protein DL96DRAFT_1602503 [Flagelloscypha sp. PMI_526]|nr:hypothetical protein DL96DRAFT_1602503 [Flagelloscypha sp. PMI_526]
MATHATTATTSTFEYRIIKYSKSNSLADGPLQAPTAAEWQHFTNPSSSTALLFVVTNITIQPYPSSLISENLPQISVESVRLRIVWVLDAGCNASNEIVFEDLDLLTFSSFPYTHPESIHGLPLKAVYRDAVSGDLQKSLVG